MKVTFTKTGIKRYRVTVEREGSAFAEMDPAPGFHSCLPHDAAHFIVESELGIKGGVFGQLASGGTANTFRTSDKAKARSSRKRGSTLAKINKVDSLFSEHAIYAAQSRWEGHDIIPETKIPPADLDRLIAKFEEFAAEWSRLPVGGSVTREWPLAGLSKRR